jgi:hypothetical protein
MTRSLFLSSTATAAVAAPEYAGLRTTSAQQLAAALCMLLCITPFLPDMAFRQAGQALVTTLH